MTEPIRLELPTLYGMKSVNAYLFIHPEPVLIDCGEKSIASWEALQAALSVYDLAVKDLKKVIITHAHVDHIGMAGKILEESDAEVWVNDYCYDWAVNTKEMWKVRTKMMQTHIFNDIPVNSEQGTNFKQMITGFMAAVMNAWDELPAERVKRFPIDGALNFGGLDWQVIYAPGHTNTQTCFYQKEKKWLISADMLLQITPTPVVEFDLDNPSKRALGLSIMLESYAKMAALEVTKVFPGHYEPFGEHRKVIDMQVGRIQMRKEQTLVLIKKGKHRFYELLDELYKNRLSMPAMSMMRGYLDVLMAEGKIEERIEDGYTAYYLV